MQQTVTRIASPPGSAPATASAKSVVPTATGQSDLPSIPVSPIPAVNVASVPQRSPLRYPGGKTWLIPHLRRWLSGLSGTHCLVEPFCGGGITSLTAVMEGLAKRCVLVEIDRDVAAFWHTALRHTDTLCERILAFKPTRDNVLALANRTPSDLVEHGFRTLVLNRTRRGGILAQGASLARMGENGKGVASRWYPETIVKRLRDIERHAPQIAFYEGDGMQFLDSVTRLGGSALFIDPPYTAGGKRAGQRLYANHEVDHPAIFERLANCNIDFLMTYDAAPEILALVRRHRFIAVQVTMKNTHHARLPELIVTRRHVFEETSPQRSLRLE